MSATGCGAEGYEDRVLKSHEFSQLAREIDELTSVGIDCNETSATEVVIFLWLASLCKGTRLQYKKGVMKFHLCFVSFNNTPVLCFFRADTLCYWNDGSVLSRFLLRKHCRVGTFIRIDLSPCCCAAHSICSIQSCFVSMRPCTLVAWLKLLHPSHLEVWFFQPCHHTYISFCLDTEIRALPTTQSHDSTNRE